MTSNTPPSALLTNRDVWKWKTELRIGAEFPDLRQVWVSMIDRRALQAFRQQWGAFPGGLLGEGFQWDVFTQIPYYQEMHNRFEAALWNGEDLIALGIGEADLDMGYVARDFNERAPTAAGQPFKGLVVPLMNICLEEWAKVVGVDHICIFDPNLPSAIRLQNYGFSYVSSIEVLGNDLGPAFYSYCTRAVVSSPRPIKFIYSLVDLAELGEASDPYHLVSENDQIPEDVTRAAQRLALSKGLMS